MQFTLSGAPDAALTVRIPGGWPVQAGEAVTLSVALSALHLFDAGGVAVPLRQEQAAMAVKGQPVPA